LVIEIRDNERYSVNIVELNAKETNLDVSEWKKHLKKVIIYSVLNNHQRKMNE
jgi:hypothetical protein